MMEVNSSYDAAIFAGNKAAMLPNHMSSFKVINSF